MRLFQLLSLLSMDSDTAARENMKGSGHFLNEKKHSG